MTKERFRKFQNCKKIEIIKIWLEISYKYNLVKSEYKLQNTIFIITLKYVNLNVLFHTKVR